MEDYLLDFCGVGIRIGIVLCKFLQYNLFFANEWLYMFLLTHILLSYVGHFRQVMGFVCGSGGNLFFYFLANE